VACQVVPLLTININQISTSRNLIVSVDFHIFLFCQSFVKEGYSKFSSRKILFDFVFLEKLS